MTAPAEAPRDHGGGLDAAVARWGGPRADWIDLSTGINPQPYPVPKLPPDAWTRLPDSAAAARLEAAARSFWGVPDAAAVLAAPGASALIARIPGLAPPGRVGIPGPTYNEHAAAFRLAGWRVEAAPGSAQVAAQVAVQPNNPDGRLWEASEITAPLAIVDESFCDVCPDRSLIACAGRPGRLVLKSFGKFWGLAGLRLGFAIGDPALVARLAEALGPWPVSGPALEIGARALADASWAAATRARLAADAARLDRLMAQAGANLAASETDPAGGGGGTSLFRLYEVAEAADWQDRLARHRIWSRIFPWSRRLIRLGLPPADGWARLTRACGTAGGAMRDSASGVRRP